MGKQPAPAQPATDEQVADAKKAEKKKRENPWRDVRALDRQGQPVRGVQRRVNTRTGALGPFVVRVDGKRISFDTLDEALEYRAARQHAATAVATSDKEINPDRPISKELIEALMLYLERRKHLSVATTEGYRKTIKSSLEPWLKTHKWRTHTLTRRQLAEWCLAAPEAMTAAYTNRVKVAYVIGRTLKDAGWRVDNPADGLKDELGKRAFGVPSPSTIRSRELRRDATGQRLYIPTWRELNELTAPARELYRLWWRWLALTGMRPSEAVGMRWDQALIDRQRGMVYVPRYPMVETNGARFVAGGVKVSDPEWEEKVILRMANERGRGKTLRSEERGVPMLDQLETLVLEPLEELRRPNQPWLFPGRETKDALNSCFGSLPMGYHHAQRRFAELTAEPITDPDTGEQRPHPLQGLQQYELRHVAASHWLAVGASIDEVAGFLGNSAALVKRTYGHLVPARAAQVGQKASRLLETNFAD